MNTILVNVISLILGAVAGSLSAKTLIKQVALQTTKPSRYVALYPFIRIAGVALLSWHLLRWGIIPFILFGGSMLLTMWITILTFND